MFHYIASTTKLKIDWCCFYYFVTNSLVALLETLSARIFLRSEISICWNSCEHEDLKRNFCKRDTDSLYGSHVSAPPTYSDMIWSSLLRVKIERVPLAGALLGFYSREETLFLSVSCLLLKLTLSLFWISPHWEPGWTPYHFCYIRLLDTGDTLWQKSNLRSASTKSNSLRLTRLNCQRCACYV